MTVELDRERILQLHNDWWKANDTLDIPSMLPILTAEAAFLMFNLNGHPYVGREGHQRIWEFLTGKYVYPEPLTVKVMQMEIRGDMAWIACEAQGRIQFLSEDANFETVVTPESESRASRTTEIFVRDDGEGNPDWRLWHFHCSPLPDLDNVRMGYDDSRRDRGLGELPHGR